MSQRVLTGRTGTVLIGNATYCRTYMWEMSLNQDVLDSTGFNSATSGNQTYRQVDLGLVGATGRIAARLTEGSSNDNPNALFDGNKHTIYLIASGNTTTPSAGNGTWYSGSAAFSRIDVSDGVDRVGDISASFTIDGVVTSSTMAS